MKSNVKVLKAFLLTFKKVNEIMETSTSTIKPTLVFTSYDGDEITVKLVSKDTVQISINIDNEMYISPLLNDVLTIKKFEVALLKYLQIAYVEIYSLYDNGFSDIKSILDYYVNIDINFIKSNCRRPSSGPSVPFKYLK